MTDPTDGSKTKTYGLLAVIAVVLALAWWWRSSDREATGDQAPEAAAGSGPATPKGSTPVVVPQRRSDVDPWQAPRAAVAGTVRDDRGQPIAGAQVCATLEDDDLAQTERHPPQCATTREDGSYRIDGLLGAEHHLYASARGYRPALHRSPSGRKGRLRPRVDLQAGLTREAVDFVLAPGGVEVTGVIKDIAGGEIEGAWVSCGADGWGSQGTAFARSDADGRFTLWADPPSVTVTAFADGYTRGSRDAAAPGTVVEIFLTPESVVIGTVVWAGSGEPVAGARVSAASSGFAAFFGPDSGSVYSGEDGRFRLEGLEPGAYKISARSDELSGLAAQKVHVGLGQTSEPVIVEVHPMFAIRGTVLVDGKTPCPHAGIGLHDRARKDVSYGSGAGQDDGTVRVKGVPPGTYEVTPYCEGAVSEDEYPDLVVTDASLQDLTWSVHDGGSIRGIVVDASGQPVEGAQVSGRGKATTDPRARLNNSWGEHTEADGSFVVDGLLPGTYELTLFHDAYPEPHEPTEVALPEGGELSGITLTMLAAGEIHGTVRDEKGVAVSGVSVRIDGPRLVEASTNDEGRFTLRGVEVGEHRLVARRDWSETMRAPGASDDDVAGQRVAVRSGEVSEVELVVESQDGRITGRVLDEDGEPVADAFVDAVRESDSAAASAGGTRAMARWGSWSRQPVLTDEDGRFELSSLAQEGVYSIHANRKGGGEAIAEHVEPGRDVQLAIEPTGALAGVVRLAGGGFPEQFTVSVTEATAGVWETDRFSRTEGQWRLSRLPPGTYAVAVEANEGNAKTEVELARGAQKTDIELELTPRVQLHGTVVDAATGDPVPGLQVMVNSADGGFVMMMGEGAKADQKDISDAQGRFEVEDAPTGKVFMIVMAPGLTQSDYGMTWISRRIAAEPRVQDLGRIELVADRLDEGQEAGDLGFETKEPEPTTEPEDVHMIVALVRPGGPAATAGLRVGDEIVSVDGQDVRGEELYRYGPLTRVRTGTSVELGVVDGEGERTVTVTAGKPR